MSAEPPPVKSPTQIVTPDPEIENVDGVFEPRSTVPVSVPLETSEHAADVVESINVKCVHAAPAVAHLHVAASTREIAAATSAATSAIRVDAPRAPSRPFARPLIVIVVGSVRARSSAFDDTRVVEYISREAPHTPVETPIAPRARACVDDGGTEWMPALRNFCDGPERLSPDYSRPGSTRTRRRRDV